jgi:hypothetical protein
MIAQNARGTDDQLCDRANGSSITLLRNALTLSVLPFFLASACVACQSAPICHEKVFDIVQTFFPSAVEWIEAYVRTCPRVAQFEYIFCSQIYHKASFLSEEKIVICLIDQLALHLPAAGPTEDGRPPTQSEPPFGPGKIIVILNFD